MFRHCEYELAIISIERIKTVRSTSCFMYEKLIEMKGLIFVVVLFIYTVDVLIIT